MIGNIKCEKVGVLEKSHGILKKDYKSEMRDIMREYRGEALDDCNETLKSKLMMAFSKQGVFGSELEFDSTQKSYALPRTASALKRCGLLMLAHMTSKLTKNSNNYSEDTINEINEILDSILYKARDTWNMNSASMEDYISNLRSIYNADKCLCGNFSNPVFLDSASNNTYIAQNRIENINLSPEQGGDFIEQAKKVVTRVHEVISLARVNGSEASKKYADVKKEVSKLRIDTESAKQNLETLQSENRKEDLSKVSSAVTRLGTAVRDLLVADNYIGDFFNKAYVAAHNTNFLVTRSFADYDDSVVKKAKPYLKADNQAMVDSAFNEIIRSSQTGVFGNNGNFFKSDRRINTDVINFMKLIKYKENKEKEELKAFMIPIEDVNGNKSILNSQELVDNMMRERRI